MQGLKGGSRKHRTKRYWLVPPELYEVLDGEFHFDFDPCPCPLPITFDGLSVPWGDRNFVNPPFHSSDTAHGSGPTAFVHKALREQQAGKTSVLLLPVRHYVNLLLTAGAEPRPLGRVPWLEVETKEPMANPTPIICFVLRGKDGK